MSQGFASSPGWFQSIMLRVREGLERVKLYDLQRFLERLKRFDPKLAPNKGLLGAAEIISLDTKSHQRAWTLILTISKPLTPLVLERALQAVDRLLIFQPCLGSEIRSPSTAPSQTKSSPRIRLSKDLPLINPANLCTVQNVNPKSTLFFT